GPSGDDPSRGASGKGVNSCPAMVRAASTPAEPCASPAASACRMVRRRQSPRPPAPRMRRPIPPPIDAPRVRQPSAQSNPAKAGSSTAFRPKRASSLGCHGRTAAAKGRMTAGKWVSAGQRRSEHMATIGTMTKHDDGHYEGELRTLSIRADITVMPVTDKATHSQPDFRVLSKGVEIGAGWLRMGQMSGKEYVSLSI